MEEAREEKERDKDAPKGIPCPSCGCCHHRVYDSTPNPGGVIVRKRICRHCNRAFTTREARIGQ